MKSTFKSVTTVETRSGCRIETDTVKAVQTIVWSVAAVRGSTRRGVRIEGSTEYIDSNTIICYTRRGPQTTQFGLDGVFGTVDGQASGRRGNGNVGRRVRVRQAERAPVQRCSTAGKPKFLNFLVRCKTLVPENQ